MQHAAAEQFLRGVQVAGQKAGAVPTSHRLVQAGQHFRVEDAVEAVVIGTADGERVDAVKAKRVRMTDDQFDRLVSRQQLDPNDKDMNRILAAAGRRFRYIHFQAGLDTLRSANFEGFTTRTTAEAGLLNSERKCDYFAAYAASQGAMARIAGQAVEAIVIHDKQPANVGGSLSIYKDTKLAAAVALHELRSGLRQLAEHYGFLVSA